jgi:uncharacterized protein (DUF779 family)
MIPMTPLKALLVRFLPALAAVAVLGTVGGYSAHEYLTGGCCHAGSPCCYPGSPCCGGHAVPGQRVAMK